MKGEKQASFRFKIRKRIMSISLITIILLMLLSSLGENVKVVEASNSVQIGEYIQFGVHNNEPILWKVIHIDDTGAPLLFSEKVLEERAFDEPSGVHGFSSNVWETSSIRHWMNSSFLQDSFMPYEQAMIIKTTLTDVNTSDKIFLLSESEITTYIPEPRDRRKPLLYWLRSPNNRLGTTQVRNVRGHDGLIDDAGAGVSLVGFAPAFFLDLRAVNFTPSSGAKTDPYIIIEKDTQQVTPKDTGTPQVTPKEGDTQQAPPKDKDTPQVTPKEGDTQQVTPKGTDTPQVTPTKGGRPQTSSVNIGVGDYIQLGNHNNEPILWKVIHVDATGSPLLFAEKVLELRAFDESSGEHPLGNNIWGTSSIRNWINNSFSQNSFTSDELAIIRDTNLTDVNSRDKIFLLSESEITSYISESKERIRLFNRNNQSYWLRSPNSQSDTGIIRFVHSVLNSGDILGGHIAHDWDVGFVPACFIEMSNVAFTSGNGTKTDPYIIKKGVGTSKPSPWAEKEIEKAKNYSLTTDKVLSDFQQDITREEFCELAIKLYEALSNKEASLPSQNPFTDTSNPYILKANNLEIVSGVGNNRFAPNDLITREQIAVMFHRTLRAVDPSLLEGTYSLTFADSNEISNWAKEAIGFMSNKGIIGGIGDNRVNPKGKATREQSIAMVVRTFERFR